MMCRSGRGKIDPPMELAVTDRCRIYKAGKCTDFIIEAGGREFPVHRVLWVNSSLISTT
jgi:hypothetical protein